MLNFQNLSLILSPLLPLVSPCSTACGRVAGRWRMGIEHMGIEECTLLAVVADVVLLCPVLPLPISRPVYVYFVSWY